MNPRYARVRPDMTIDEAVSYLRKLARQSLGTSPTPTYLTSSRSCSGPSHCASCSPPTVSTASAT
jgi:hypothetical protein